MLRVSLAAAALGAALLAMASPAAADEGMWTFENFPAAKVKDAYGVTTDGPWLQRLRGAAVRIPGCSASVVSSAGLVLTNNHCITSCLVQLSSADKDHLKDGVLTASRAEERQCAGMWAEVLMETTDITDQVRAAVAGKSGAAFTAARDAVTSAAEGAACKGVAAARCQTTSLYRGGQYVVYRYHRYSDVRMVFAPEFATAFFGGDPDNFNFPRFTRNPSSARWTPPTSSPMANSGNEQRTPALFQGGIF